MIAITEQTTMRAQFNILSFLPISFLNSFRWKASGRMIQMLKHMAEPRRATI